MGVTTNHVHDQQCSEETRCSLVHGDTSDAASKWKSGLERWRLAVCANNYAPLMLNAEAGAVQLPAAAASAASAALTVTRQHIGGVVEAEA